MATEIAVETTEDVTLPPSVDTNGVATESAPQPPAPVAKKPPKPERKDGDEAPSGVPKLSKPLRELKNAEDQTLKEIVENLGREGGGYKISVRRIEPTEARDPTSGRMVQTAGLLKTYESEPVDEDFVQKRHGGGIYDLRIQRRGDTGAFQFVTQKRIQIAGDPRLDDIPRNVGKDSTAPAAPPPVVQSEAPSLATKAMDLMAKELDKAREYHAPPPAVDVASIVKPLEIVIKSLQDQLASQAAEASRREANLLQQLAEARDRKVEEDPIKSKILNNLLDGESGRITALRTTHEAEIRILKENSREEEKRLRDSFERDKQSLSNSFERERQTMIHSHEVALASSKANFETQIKVLEGQIRTLERDNNEIRIEVKELRAKKDKSIVEMAKEMEIVKEALGAGDSESSMADKIADVVTNPDVIGFAGRMFGKNGQPATGNPAAPAQPQQQHVMPPGGYKPQLVNSPDGQTWMLGRDGKLHGPVEKKKKGARASEPQLPVIDPEKVASAVSFLERAFQGGQDPEAVAQGARALVPDEIIAAIRDHGVDVFMSKIAKPAASSPLSNQEGRNWVRKLGKALVG